MNYRDRIIALQAEAGVAGDDQTIDDCECVLDETCDPRDRGRALDRLVGAFTDAPIHTVLVDIRDHGARLDQEPNN